MSETGLVVLFTVVRVLLFGGILLILPRVTRKGLLFGAYVGEEFADSEAARVLVRRWTFGCVILMVIALVAGLGISAAGRPLAGNLTATLILMLAALGLYLRLYYAARASAPPAAAGEALRAAAVLEEGEPRGTTLAVVAIVLCLLSGLAALFHATISYDAMPARVPVHFGTSGEPDGWADKSYVSATLLPTLNLVICPFLGLFALLTARAKRSIRGGSGGRSVEAQEAFRAAVANLLSGTALFTCALMTFLSVQGVRIALSQARSLGSGVWWILGAMLLYLFGGLLRIIAKYGQGGALVEQGSAEAPLTDGLADNAHWYWGVFYVNREDPSILVEKRFGIGYTINFGNPKAVAIFATFLVLTLGIAAISVIARL